MDLAGGPWSQGHGEGNHTLALNVITSPDTRKGSAGDVPVWATRPAHDAGAPCERRRTS